MVARVLLLTQWFDPEPTFKGLVFARELVKQGFDVEVVTGFPNYPGGKLYFGYRLKLIRRELIDGVNITRLPLYPSHGQSAIGRILNYISFMISLLVYGLLVAKRSDVIYAYHPPLTVGVAAALIRFFRRIPVVCDVQDMWPDTLRATGMLSNERILKIISSVCNWVYRSADKIVVLSPGFKRLLIRRGVPKRKVEVIHNWCAEAALTSTACSLPFEFPGPESFKVLFAGNMGKAQALSAVLLAAGKLQTQSVDVTFIFLGDGVELNNLKALAEELKLRNVLFLPAVPMSEVGGLLQAADVLLVHLKQDPLFEITIPSKTQAYMAVGKPILMAVDGDAAELIVESGCGRVAESENPDSIADAVLALKACSESERADMGLNAKMFYEKKLSLAVGISHFGNIFRCLAGVSGNKS